MTHKKFYSDLKIIINSAKKVICTVGVYAEHQDEITYDTFLEGCRIIKGKVTKVTPVQICVNGKFYDYAEGKVVFDKLEYCILSLVYDGDMLFQGNMMDSIYPDNLIDIDESVGITKEEIFV